uniref:pre-B lymphocyte protein 3 n=1 Tax=Lonchura striata TaxID=40157 RepID=UPI000B4CBA88|nr:pre-B lymphocyte protein 3 [Lonchura striata domestica]
MELPSPSLTAPLVRAAARAQPVLSQPQSVFVLPGQSARLFCTLSPQYNISQFGISWYQQRPGRSLSYLLYYNSEWDKHKPARTPDRFSATKDLASNACILTIAADEESPHNSHRTGNAAMAALRLLSAARAPRRS